MRKMGPLSKDHPIIADKIECPACKKVFTAGDYLTLIALGPGESEEARAKAQDGKPYNAVAAPVHWLCAGGSN